MGSFGERMKREREMRSITLEEIATSTKIGTRSLKALEDEDFDQLPGGIFNKGFVRAYAKYLGIDEEQAVADFMAALEEAQKPPTIVIEAQARAEREKKESAAAVRPWLALLAIVVVIGLGVVGWRWWQGQHEEETPPPPVATRSKPAPVAPSQPATTATTSATPNTMNPTSTDTTTGTAANPTSPSTTNPATPDTTTPTPPDTDTTATKTKPVEFTVDLHTRKASWVSIVVDGKQRFNGLMTEYQQRSYSAKNEIKVSMGNAGGVELTFNGSSLGVLGAEDKPRTVTFTPNGLRQ